MTFQDRITSENAIMPYVNLNDREADLYHGCGDAYVLIDDGEIMQISYVQDSDSLALAALKETASFLKDSTIWKGMLSCYQLCQPKKIN